MLSVLELLLSNTTVGERFHCASHVALRFARGFIQTQRYYVLHVGWTDKRWGQFCPPLVSAYGGAAALAMK